ncbi:MAG: class I SAM-dependent methyltransferase [Cyanobium sp.]
MSIRNVAGGDSLRIFERSWQTYQQLVAHDLMEHHALGQAIERRLLAWLEERQAAGLSSALAMADLACGDLTTLAPLLRRLPLRDLQAVDAAAGVLPQAAARLGPVPYPCRWRAMDLLLWSESAADHPSGPCDLITCLFGLHHLADADKWRFLELLPRQLAPGGRLLIGDLFRQPAESRQAYLARYRARVNSWSVLEPASRQLVMDHMASSDYPAAGEQFAAMAESLGWQVRWLWHGSGRAEGLLELWRPGE